MDQVSNPRAVRTFNRLWSTLRETVDENSAGQSLPSSLDYDALVQLVARHFDMAPEYLERDLRLAILAAVELRSLRELDRDLERFGRR